MPTRWQFAVNLAHPRHKNKRFDSEKRKNGKLPFFQAASNRRIINQTRVF